MVQECPKCGRLQENDIECEACGIVFAKYEKLQNREPEETPQPAPEPVEPAGPAPKSGGMTWVVVAVAAVACIVAAGLWLRSGTAKPVQPALASRSIEAPQQESNVPYAKEAATLEILKGLQRLQSAKLQWVAQTDSSPGTPVTEEDLAAYMSLPTTPEGAVYSINEVGRPPTCEFNGQVFAAY